jgi:hypothetical protein
MRQTGLGERRVQRLLQVIAILPADVHWWASPILLEFFPYRTRSQPSARATTYYPWKEIRKYQWKRTSTMFLDIVSD